MIIEAEDDADAFNKAAASIQVSLEFPLIEIWEGSRLVVKFRSGITWTSFPHRWAGRSGGTSRVFRLLSPRLDLNNPRNKSGVIVYRDRTRKGSCSAKERPSTAPGLRRSCAFLKPPNAHAAVADGQGGEGNVGKFYNCRRHTSLTI